MTNTIVTWTGISLNANNTNQQTFYLTATLNDDYPVGTQLRNTAEIRMPIGREDREIITITDIPTNNRTFVTGAVALLTNFMLDKTPDIQWGVSGALVPFTIAITGDNTV